MKFPAAIDDQADTARATTIPTPLLTDKNMPIKPKPSIGSKPYPTVLIMLYRGIISFLIKTKIPEK